MNLRFLLHLTALVTVTLAQRTVSAAAINSLWTSPVAGSWGTAANWSPQQVPNNGANTFNVTLAGAADTGPTVTAPTTISSLTVPSPASLTLSGNFTTGSAAFGNSPNPALQPDGSLMIAGGFTASLGTLANYNASTRILTDGSFDISGTLRFTGASIVANAASITLQSTGVIRNQTNNADALATSFAENASTGTFDINDRTFATAGNFTNDGFLGVEAILTNTTFTVPSNGSVLTNFSGNTLSDGSYFIAAYSPFLTARLAFPSANIVTNQADISLWGTNSQIFNQTTNLKTLDNTLSINGTSGTLSLTGRALTTASSFTNNGSIKLTADYPGFSAIAGILDIPNAGTLTNFSGGTLTGGTFYIGDSCVLRFPGADIVTNAADLTIEGSGRVVNKSNLAQPNGLLNLSTNAAAGSFTLVSTTFQVAGNFNNAGTLELDGSALQIANSLTNSGEIKVYAFAADTDSLITVAGLTNFSGTTLTGGSFLLSAESGVSATLKFPGANIAINAASISLAGEGASIRNANDDSDALANLSNNASGAALAILGGKNLLVSGAFNNAGTLTIGTAGTFTVQSGNTYTQSNGLTTLAGGTLAASSVSVFSGQLQGSGNIVGNTAMSASTLAVSIRGLTPGANDSQYDQINVTGSAALAGTLSVSLGGGLANTLLPSDTFSILTTTGLLTGSFSNAQNGSRVTTTNHAGSFLVAITANSVVLSDFYPTLGLTTWKTAPGMFSTVELADPNFSTADPENDGLKNIMEYSFNRQPHTPDSAGTVQGGIVTDGGGTYLALTFTRFKGASDIAFQVEVSNDLQTWNSGSPFTTFQNRVDQGATELITWRDNTAVAGAANRFIRLKFIVP